MVGSRTLGLLALLAAVLGPPAYSAAHETAAGPAPDHDRPVIYRGATLIDGTGAPPRPAMAIVVDGATIASVLPVADLAPDLLRDAQIVDVSGLYGLPGLIDSHEHLATPPDRRRAEALMRRDLYGGVTAVRSMADDVRQVGELARQSLLGEIPGPDIYYAALMAGPSFFDDPRTAAVSQGAVPGEVPWMQAITDDTDLPIAVAMARGTYASAVKIYANLPASLVKAITAEAHRQNFPVWAHGMVFPAMPDEVVAAGPDVISHVCYLAYQVSDEPPQSYQGRVPVDYAKFEQGDNPELAKLFKEMRRRNIILDATVRVYAESDKRSAAGKGPPPHCTLDLAAKLTRQAHREGVLISAGTDGFTPASDPWPSLHEELELLQDRVGMAPAEIIRSATLVGAMAIGRAAEMGTVEAGKLANLVFVSKDPLQDVGNLRSVVLTVKRGKRYERSDYRPITPEEIGETK